MISCTICLIIFVNWSILCFFIRALFTYYIVNSGMFLVVYLAVVGLRFIRTYRFYVWNNFFRSNFAFWYNFILFFIVVFAQFCVSCFLLFNLQWRKGCLRYSRWQCIHIPSHYMSEYHVNSRSHLSSRCVVRSRLVS